MRGTFNFNFYVRKSKVQKNGLAPMEVSICVNGDRVFVQLPYKCRPEEFNKKRQPKELVDYVAAMRKRINELLADMVASSTPLTANNLKKYLKSGGFETYTLGNSASKLPLFISVTTAPFPTSALCSSKSWITD